MNFFLSFLPCVFLLYVVWSLYTDHKNINLHEKIEEEEQRVAQIEAQREEMRQQEQNAGMDGYTPGFGPMGEGDTVGNRTGVDLEFRTVTADEGVVIIEGEGNSMIAKIETKTEQPKESKDFETPRNRLDTIE